MIQHGFVMILLFSVNRPLHSSTRGGETSTRYLHGLSFVGFLVGTLKATPQSVLRLSSATHVYPSTVLGQLGRTSNTRSNIRCMLKCCFCKMVGIPSERPPVLIRIILF